MTTPEAREPEAVAARLFDVRGRSAMVTGAASGLGRAMAEVLAAAGAGVTLADRDPAGLEKAGAELAAAGGNVRQAQVDVRDAGQVRAAVADTVQAFGGLDVVFANAGIAEGAGYSDPDWRLEAFPEDSWERVVAVNLSGALHTMRAAAEVMRRQGAGRIVVTASTAGLRADPMVAYSYVAAKAALINVVKQAALDLAPHGVRVNAIAPGPFHTNIGGEKGKDPAVEKTWSMTVPLGRMGNPEEIKGLVLLLASDASSFMTGAVYPVDGGALATSHIL
ncbi:MAG TPA: SDR family NAD(P)-dependent oxidoreductase [Streptosporangiaceae bacterium]|jgi:NAD(P)-dependent dehydrogenase (short-subunit alcohol dehydrogenase family)